MHLSARGLHSIVLGAVALAAGCSGAAVAPTAPDAQQRALSNSRTPHGWMAPDVKHRDLLYVSDLGTELVDVYSYPEGKLKGSLSGFQAVHSGCVDPHGNVFITSSERIYEFAHGGTKPIRTLVDAGYGPTGCSVDPVTGTLAVANIGQVSGSAGGNIAFYKHAKGTPKMYADPAIFFDYDCAYDDNGNLYVVGGDIHGFFKFAEIAAGATSFLNITLDQSINVPGGVQWDGKYVAVEDQGAGYHGSTVYQFSIAGSSGTKVGTTTLGGSSDAIAFWLEGDRIIAPNIGSSPNVMIWQYPTGGSARKTITGFTEPVGVTVSRGR
jgi:DNA-binding beta-propeller fold protein YncE